MPAPQRKSPRTRYFTPPEAISRASSRVFSCISTILDDLRDEKVYKMRADMLSTAATILQILVDATSLQHDGAIVDIYIDRPGKAHPMTVALIAARAGVPTRTVERYLSMFEKIGLLVRDNQVKIPRKDGSIEVSGVQRRLTDKFWRAIGLFDMFKAACAAAMQKITVELVKPRYLIKNAWNKAKRIVDRALGVQNRPKKHQHKPLQQQLEEMFALERAWKQQGLLI